MTEPHKPQRPKPSSITETINGFVRILTMSAPFDLRNPNPNQNYGIHGMDLRMTLHKDDLAIHFVASLPVYLPHVVEELLQKHSGTGQSYNPFSGMGSDVGYHSLIQQYDSQEMDDCDVLAGGKCYNGGSALQADEWYAEFLTGGLDRIWEKLEERWQEMCQTA